MKITKAEVWHYNDNNQTAASVEWLDGSITSDTTCPKPKRSQIGSAELAALPTNKHMRALFARAVREGLDINYGESYF